MRLVRLALVFAVGVCMLGLGVSGASAEEARPGWELFGRFAPSDVPPGGTAVLHLYVYNTGARESEGNATLTDHLPAGLEAVNKVQARDPQEELLSGYVNESPGCSTGVEVKCELSQVPATAEPIELEIPVTVSAGLLAGSHAVDPVKIVGGGALSPATASVPVVYGTGPAPVGFSNFDAWYSNPNGTVDTQAGSHPYGVTVAFATNSVGMAGGGEQPSVGEPFQINVNLPPGLVGEPGAVPQCPRTDFDSKEAKKCPITTRIGEDYPAVSGAVFGFNVYNLVPPPGVAALFGFNFNGTSTFIEARVRSGGDYGITESTLVPQRAVVFNTITIWGNPGEHIFPGESQHELEERGMRPLITLPTSCNGPRQFSIETLGTWQYPSLDSEPFSIASHNEQNEQVGFTGCDKLIHFEPSLTAAPDTTAADSPAGLSSTVSVPQRVDPEQLATSGLKDATVVLPEGVVVNPGQATGLTACQNGRGPGTDNLPSPGQDGEKEEWDGPPECPSSSKVGTDEIVTPLLKDRLEGNVYVLPSNPPEVKLLVAASGDGINLKLVGTVHLNEQTGQLTTTFENTPDAPFNEFKLNFSGGAQAALITPSKCGTYETTAVFTPWSSPLIENALSASRFAIDTGPEGSPCQNPEPFSPTMSAGSTTDQAGGYTDFSMLLQRSDGQQRIESLSFKAPEGLAGMIAKIPVCGELQANEGTCPAASQIGHTVVGAGAGPYPFFIPQTGAPPAPIYLTGPYKGAPFGLSIVVPLIAGPFNLGTEIVRARIEVDPRTAQITVTTDPLPTIVKGIPADMRSIDAVIDKPEFMFNPTNCNPMSFSGTATSTEGATAPLSSHFQVGSCQALKFQPNFKVTTTGKTSRADGAGLTAKIVYPVGNLGANQASSQSNIKAVKVDLPKQLPSRLTTLQKACPAKVFEANPADCPADSIVGHGRAITPLLPVPVEGPAYFVSHAGEEFPNLIVVLQGDNVTVDLVGDTFIDTKTNITSSTFKEVPDVPIQSFELNLPQGPYSALAANTNLCKVKGGLKMPTAFTGQNGAVIHESTPIGVTGCAKATKKHKKAKKHEKSHKARKAKKK